MYSRISSIFARNGFGRCSFNNFGTSSKQFRQLKSIKQVFENNFKNVDYSKAKRTFQIVGAGSSALGISIICYYGLRKTDDNISIMNKSVMWPQYVRDRVHATYTYFALSNLSTAAVAVYVLSKPKLFRFAASPSIPKAIGGILVIALSGLVAHAIPYTPEVGVQFASKHLAWLFFSGSIGLILSPLSLYGGHAIKKAAIYTLGLVSGLSAVAVSSPSDKFLYMGGPLAMGLGLVFVSSIAGMFLNPLSQIGAAVLSFQIYGGLVFFSGFLLFNTQRVIRRAESHPVEQPSYDGRQQQIPFFDPIANSMGIYLDTVNIFIRLVTIFGMGGGQKKR